ncbi:hypothetical protein BJV78DRAFT_1286999 [Lactifluus subvellereus]|nr:hypothetical protein BJV78DRAFT_1286999 [Lactifluus subvellereus]
MLAFMCHLLTLFYVAAPSSASQLIAEASLETGTNSILDDGEQFFLLGNEFQGNENPWDDDNDNDYINNNPDIEPVDQGTAHAVYRMNSSHLRHRHDKRTHQHRNAQLHAAWAAQIPSLVSAYLAYKSDSAMDIDAAPEGSHIFHIDVLGLRGTEHYLTGIHVLNLILEHLTWKPITQNQDEEANITLIRHGLLGASPSQIRFFTFFL